MESRTPIKQTRIGRDTISLGHCLHMTTTHLDAYAGTIGAKGRRSHTCHILSQCQRGTSTQEAKRLTIPLVDLHACHTSIVLKRRDKLHTEGGTQIRLLVDNPVYSFYVHNYSLFDRLCRFARQRTIHLNSEYSGTLQARALAPSTSRSRSSSFETRSLTLFFRLPNTSFSSSSSAESSSQ